MDIVGPIKFVASNGHSIILVAIDNFTKWVKATSYKVVTKKAIAYFVRDRIVCRFGVPESIIIDNANNLNHDLIKVMSVIPAEVEILSLRIIQEVELIDAEWVQSRYEQLALIGGKRMNAVCHSQLYQNRMVRAFNKKVRPRQFTPGQLVLKRIFPHQDEAKGKFSPNWQGPYMVH
ncbi:uncharacterized protein [Nicotiana sylvestris]|uniref:uncharacterized protein n=1 Tax=Nicotiana sylvestris TaxID=4096 RepID=UPI00388C4009